MKADWPLSASATDNTPPATRLPALTLASSFSVAVAPEITAASLLPLMVTVTEEVVPSRAETEKVSLSVCPAPSACTAGAALFSV